MTRQAGIYGIIALIGLAVGMGVGVMITKQKINKANTIIEQLQTQQSQTEAKLQTATDKVNQYESELIKARNNTVQMNTELARAKTELTRMKSVIEQLTSETPESAVQPSTAATPSTAAVKTESPVALPVGVKEYTVKDGDSLWKIAANELGNGVRFEEILKLNPQIKRDSTLAVGTKIKLPAK